MSRKNRQRQQAQGRPEPKFIEDLQKPDRLVAQLLRLKEECEGFDSFASAMSAAFSDSFAMGGDVSGTPITECPQGVVYNQRQAYTFALTYPCKTACVYINEAQHRMIRARSRAFASVSSYWQGIVHSMKTHVVAKGHNYMLAPRHKDAPPSDDILRKAQYETDRFIQVNKYRQVQCEKLERQHEDGEHILRYNTSHPDGVMRVRFVEPLLLWSPTAHDNDVWFGIRYEDDDYEDPKGYFIQQAVWSGARSPVEPDEVQPSEIQHRKMNVTRNSPRGIPSTYPIQTLLEQSTKTLATIATLVEIRSRIALIRSHVNATAASVQQMLSPTMFQKVYGGSSGSQTTVMRWQPGTILDKSDQAKYEFPPQNVDADKTVQSVQANLRAVAVKFGFPEYLISADSGGSSYSGGMVAEGPVVKTFESAQQDMIEDDTEVLERNLLHAAEKGRLPENILELVKIDIQPPTLAGRNRVQDVQADTLLVQENIIDRRTATTRQGFDPDEVEENLAKQEEADREKQKKDIAAGITSDPNKPKGGDGEGNKPTGPRRRDKVTNRPFAPGDEERNVQRPLKEESFQEQSSGRDKPTQSEIEMARVWITDDWLKRTQGDILALPRTPSPIDPATADEYEPGVKGIYLGMVDNQKVHAVDMRALTVKHEAPDLIVAGNSERWPFCPVDVIFVDWAFTACADRDATLLHECCEFVLMRDGKFGYSLAHKLSNHFELEWLVNDLRPELADLKPTA